MSPVPVAAYQISGEYAMIEAAAANGWIDRGAAITESVLGIRRAGADMVLTYWAAELAGWLKTTEDAVTTMTHGRVQTELFAAGPAPSCPAA